MTSSPGLAFRRYDGASASAERATVEAIYLASYTAEQQADPFNSPATWMSRFDGYADIPGFGLVIAYSGAEPAAQAFGWPLGPQSSWWTGLVVEPEPGFTSEDGGRTFALSEIMVRQVYVGKGIAHATHDELLSGRLEKRATLLVEPDNTPAYRAYTGWGWQHVAQLRPGWPDAPMFDVLILPLPLR